MEHKTVKAQAQLDSATGSVSVRFATLGVIDKDGDVTVAGAFDNGAPARISAYNHSSWGGALPVGKGVIQEQGGAAIFNGAFFLDMQSGEETYKAVKNMGDLQEWSYGFDILESGDGEHDGRQVRLLKRLKVHEISPVLLGAGIDTQTLSIKASAAEPNSDIRVIRASVAHARALIKAGKTDTGPWSFSAADGNALLGTGGDDWANYKLWHLAQDADETDNTKARYMYPYGKSGKVYRRALIAAKSRSAQQGHDTVNNAAAALLDYYDQAAEGKSGARLIDQIDIVHADILDLVSRSQAVAKMRAEKNRELSHMTQGKLSEVSSTLEMAARALADLATSAPDNEPDVATLEVAYLKTMADLNGRGLL